MSKLTIILAALVACLGVSALSSASAMASCGSESDTTEEWCMGGKALVGSAELATTAKVEENGKLTGLGLEYECTTLTGEGSVIAPKSGSLKELTFGGCKNGTAAACKVAGTSVKTNEITVSNVKEVGANEVEATFEPKTKGGAFATIEVSGETCSISGSDPVTGKLRILGPTGQKENKEQEIVANSGSAELTVLKKEVKLKGKAKVSLKVGEPWSFD